MEHVHGAHSPLALREDNAQPPPILLDELVDVILSRLPVKSLIRFRCVCKYWKSIISNPNFIKLHLQKSPKIADIILASTRFCGNLFADSRSLRLSLKNPSSTIIIEDLSHCLRLERDYNLIGSCNGLFCLVRDFQCGSGFCFRFLNHATRMISKTTICFLFDLERGPISGLLFGFGYDNLNDTYKVVVAVKVADNDVIRMKVYSLDDKCWRNIPNFTLSGRVMHRIGVYLNGTLNWLALGHFNSNERVIVSLDLGKEITYTQLLPPCGLQQISHLHLILGVLMDCLYLSHDYKRTHFVVWQMKEFGVQSSWTQLLNVNYQDIPIDGVGFDSLSLLYVYENGDILITMAYPDQLQASLYNPRDNSVKPIKTFHDTYNMRRIYVMDYIESLVSPS